MKAQLLKITTLAICLGVFYALPSYAQKGEEQYQQALKLNKVGSYQESARILKTLMTQHPDIERFRSDYIAVASNAKECKEVLGYANRSYLDSAPIYVQDAIFSCALQTYSIDELDQLAKVILSKRQKNQAIEEKLIQLALEKKQIKLALEWSQRYVKNYPNELNAWMLRAQVFEDANKPYEALRIYEQLRTQYPKNAVVERKYINQLLDMGMPHLALRQIQQGLSKENRQQRLRAEANSGAVDIRWSDADSTEYPDRFLSLDQAINRLNQALALESKTGSNPQIVIQIQSDLVTAYEKRKEWKKSINAYQELLNQQIAVADYALLSAAISYGALHQYQEATAILAPLYQKNLSDPEVAYEYYYNLVDRDDYLKAKAILDKLTAEFKQRSKALEPSAINYTGLLINQVFLESYQDRHQAAFEKLNALFNEAPANTELLIAAGTISEWQGNSEASEEFFRIAANQDFKNIEAKVGIANAQMSQGDIKPFINTVNQLKNPYGDMIAVQKAAERLEILMNRMSPVILYWVMEITVSKKIITGLQT